MRKKSTKKQRVRKLLDSNYPSALGSEEIVNGDFSDEETGWSFGPGWTVEGQKATYVVFSGTGILQQAISLTDGKNYYYSFESDGDYNLTHPPSVVINDGVAMKFDKNGTHSGVIKADKALAIKFTLSTDNSFEGTIDNVSIRRAY